MVEKNKIKRLGISITACTKLTDIHALFFFLFR